MFGCHLQRFDPIRGHNDVIAADLQVARDVLAHWSLVVRDEDRRSHVGYPFREPVAIGSVKTKAAPPPSRCSAQIRPSCARMMLRQIASPNPVPGLAGYPAVGSRKNGSKIRSMCSGGIPRPRSSIRKL